MTDAENNDKKPTTKLSLKKPAAVDTDRVRQSFSHGRSKTVEVEVRRKRVVMPQDKAEGGTSTSPTEADPQRAARLKALQQAIQEKPAQKPKEKEEAAEPEVTQEKGPETPTATPEVESAPASQSEKTEPAEKPQQPQRKQPPARKVNEPRVIRPIVFRAGEYQLSKKPVPKPDEAQEKKKPAAGDGSARRGPARPGDQSEPSQKTDTQHHKYTSIQIPKDDENDDRDTGGDGVRRSSTYSMRRESMRTPRLGRMDVSQAMDDEAYEQRSRSIAAARRAAQKSKKKIGPQADAQKIIREVIVPEAISVQELANRMAVRGADLVKVLIKMGMMVTVNQIIDADTAELLVAEFGHTCKRVSDLDVEGDLKGPQDEAVQLIARAPVVTVMGHVDHGKTSLLDAIRQTDVVSGEAGGITQHIGAYQVHLKDGRAITFIDTPGHEAFSHMRARGANITDVVVLVVAADDGIKPQTIEAISHAKAAGVPMVVAINKIDKPGANVDRIRNELLSQEIVVEQLGGDVLSVEVSAKQRTNIDKLEEAILLQAEILDLKANPNRTAQGIVIESQMVLGRGNIATVLVQRGTLHVGDVFVAGEQWGRVRALTNERNERLKDAPPSTAVVVQGFDGVAAAGDEFYVVESESKARQIAEMRQAKAAEARAAALLKLKKDTLFTAADGMKQLTLVLKSDVQGSLEAISASLAKLSTDEVAVKIMYAGVGAISESDINLATSTNALVVGFNVRANPQARDVARRENIDIRYYSIIYNIIDDVKALMSGLLAPTLREKFLGNAEIRQVFGSSKTGNIAGCMITEGMVKRGAKVRLLRDNVVIHEGVLKTLRRFKDEVKEVKEGFECGMAFESYNDIREGDVIECFEMEEIARAL